MLTLFRKIRKSFFASGLNLKSTSPVGRYLFYAIGEIALVVIGILIALQINNWNERKKALSQVEVYKQRMLEDLKNNRENLERTSLVAWRQLEYGQKVLDHLTGKRITNSYVDLLVATYGGRSVFAPVFDDYTWNEMNTSGIISLFEPQLRSDLKNLYENLFKFIQNYSEYKDLEFFNFVNTIIPSDIAEQMGRESILLKNLSRETLSISNVKYTLNITEADAKEIFDELAADPRFGKLLNKQLTEGWRYPEQYLKNAIDAIDEIIYNYLEAQ